MWDEFLELSHTIHKLFVTAQCSIADSKFRQVNNLRPLWISYCHCISRIIAPNSSMRLDTKFCSPITCMQQNAEAIGGSVSSHSFTFALQYELCSRELRNFTEHAMAVLTSYRDIKWKSSQFYTVLLTAILKTECQLYNRVQANTDSSVHVEWIKFRWFLFGKLPDILSLFEKKDTTVLFYEPPATFNAIEKSLLHIYLFPALYKRTQGESL